MRPGSIWVHFFYNSDPTPKKCLFCVNLWYGIKVNNGKRRIKITFWAFFRGSELCRINLKGPQVSETFGITILNCFEPKFSNGQKSGPGVI